MRTRTPKPKSRPWNGSLSGLAALLGGGLLYVILLAGARAGSGQEKQQATPPPDKPQAAWTMESHDRTNFPLVGKHRTLNCADCHTNKVFEGTPVACEACHWERVQDDRYRLRLGMKCGDCHTPQSWKKVDPAKWDHQTVTGFRLDGAHRFLDCEDCHGAQGFKAVPADCYGCHAKDYQRATDPNHVQSGFPTDCSSCHSTRSWSGATFAHTGFVLQGRHATAGCSACHANGVYAGTPTDCASCHLNDYNNATDPNHRQSGFSLDCTTCHGTSAQGWTGATFAHTGFVLQGRHLTAACTACHANGVYAGTPTACSSCHINDYNGATDPNHRQAGFSLDCTTCHGTSAAGWSGATFNHTGFVLRGRHLTAACTACHANGVYAGTPTACSSCHINDYNAATDPNHRALGYSLDCQTCHGTSATGWDRAPRPFPAHPSARPLL